MNGIGYTIPLSGNTPEEALCLKTKGLSLYLTNLNQAYCN